MEAANELMKFWDEFDEIPEQSIRVVTPPSPCQRKQARLRPNACFREPHYRISEEDLNAAAEIVQWELQQATFPVTTNQSATSNTTRTTDSIGSASAPITIMDQEDSHSHVHSMAQAIGKQFAPILE
ncbi:hypothetical protein PINS_up011891 [Pythium insidiosum]|nr:hypothetical protein PINS_up011891 [Pythium insidiosum]